jgi:hypothetical protein
MAMTQARTARRKWRCKYVNSCSHEDINTTIDIAFLLCPLLVADVFYLDVDWMAFVKSNLSIFLPDAC